jgi:hypothetical protein
LRELVANAGKTVALLVLRDEAKLFTTALALDLMASIAWACDWELHRRRGHEFILAGPRAAIDPEALAVSMSTLVVLSTSFRKQSRVHTLLVAMGEALRGAPPTLQ